MHFVTGLCNIKSFCYMIDSPPLLFILPAEPAFAKFYLKVLYIIVCFIGPFPCDPSILQCMAMQKLCHRSMGLMDSIFRAV